MYYPTKKEFINLTKKGNLIPVYREIVADMETPVSAYKKIESKNSFLLESIEGGEKIARYSFLRPTPKAILKSKGNAIEIKEGSKVRKFKGNPFDALKDMLKHYRPVKIPALPRFSGGAVGYIAYDMVRYIEDIPDKNKDDIKLPQTLFLLSDTVLAFDHIKKKIIVIANAFVGKDAGKAYEAAKKKIDSLVKKLNEKLKQEKPKAKKSVKEVKIKSNMTKEEYEGAVSKAKEYIKAGDIIQVVPSQRFETSFKGEPFDVYRALRTINPSPYMYYLHFGDLKIIGSSPEVMVRFEDGIATVRPIAGTRKRGETPEEDEKLAKELLADAKERAEHVMLVDLGRNDLGRVCDFGSVRVTEEMVIEKYSHVMHIVSNVSGKLKKDKDAFDLLMASFPAGTVTGAPKVRAMEIIDELENVKRGPYAGAIGYFSFSGELDTCITIRTIIIKGGKAYVQAGAGIVADSVPEREYQETVNKAKALFKAIEESS